jgi:membrane protein DedA with SNARE-associated domain
MNGIPEFLTSYGDAALFLAVFSDQAGLPLPSAPWLLAAGALAAGGQLSPVLAVVLTTVACLMADSMWFYLGRVRGQRMLSFLCRMSLATDSCPKRTERLIARHGMLGLMAAKFVPGLGAIMPPLAGVFGISPRRFLLFDAMGSVIYGSFYVLVGYVFKAQVQQALGFLSHLGTGAVAILAAVAVGYVGYKYFRRRQTRTRSVEVGRRDVEPSPAEDTTLGAIDEDESVVLVPVAGVQPSLCGRT